MPNEFLMPSLGPDMEAGTLVEWHVKVGDQVKRGDVVALVETDKGIIDVEVFADGTIEKLLIEPGTHVPVGTPLALLSGNAAAPDAAARPQSEPIAPVPIAPAPAPAATPVAARGRHRVSPAARTRAHALGIDPASIAGTGADGVVTLQDVLRHASAPPAAAEPQHDMRKVIARAMSRSKREIPHYYLSTTCCLLALRTWLDAHNATVGIEQRLLPAALFLKSVALAARAMPDFNGFHDGEEFKAAPDVNVGMAIAMRGGRLVAPAMLNADAKTLATVMNDLRDLTTRVRSGHMRGSELALPTITVTSLGEEAVDMIIPAIYPPQVAIVGFGAIVERPWVIEGAVQAAPVVTVCLAADHRVSDGRAGARFLSLICERLRSPHTL